MAVSLRGLGAVSSWSPTSHLTFFQVFCSVLHRRSCRGSSESDSTSPGGPARPRLSSARSFGVGSSVGSGAGQSPGIRPGIRPGVVRSSPLFHPAPPVRILPDSGRPVCGRRSGYCVGRPVRTCCIAGFRCSVFLIVLSISHSYLIVFVCNAWDFGALSGSFCWLWTELTLERPFTAPS
ncbi:hypothetical protein NDU88_002054 [Pleurodeles waltl]|uniref:Uncharacterized protein n=1 Tax=Pleurodeles waltl TaxID=8319 RepID=A0AAV7SDU7_PLEWA|nr:hypothetical protein NDU88_002054 [Pleurodeles waltl]